MKTSLEGSRLKIDFDTLEQMLSIGGEEMRAALKTQLMSDLLRLERELDDSASQGPQAAIAQVRRAAHELKGLTSTFGATSVAELAGRLDQLADVSPAPVRESLTRSLRQEVNEFRGLLAANSTRTAAT